VALSLLNTLPAWATAPLDLAEKMALAEAAVQQANATSNVESAENELQIANNRLISARKAWAERDYSRAEQLADPTQVDAQVPQMHADCVRSGKAAH